MFACLVSLVATVGVEVAVVVTVGVEIIKEVHLAEDLLVVVVAEVTLNGERGKGTLKPRKHIFSFTSKGTTQPWIQQNDTLRVI